MFEKLKIKKFRMHDEQEIEFAPDITTIIGDSFTGKSTIVKALIWILCNRPAGDSVINWDKPNQKAIGTLTIDGGNVVKRIKGNGKNIYKLNKDKFVAFGRGDVPAEIAKLVNVSDVNIQGQFEPFFWFSKTAGEVSRQLNQIVNLEIVDTTMANIASEIRKTSATVDVTQTRLDSIKVQRKKLLYVEDMDKDLKIVENKQNQWQKTAVNASELNELIKTASLHQKTIKNARAVSLLGDLAVSAGQSYLDIKTKSNNLNLLIKNIVSLQKQTASKIPSLEPLNVLYETFQTMTKRQQQLSALVEKIVRMEKGIKTLKTVFESAESSLKQKIGKVCPLCQRPM